MFCFQILAALLLVSSALACAPSCPSRVVRVPIPCEDCSVVKCSPLQKLPIAECETMFGAGNCRDVPGTRDSVLDCGADKLAYKTANGIFGKQKVLKSGKCYTDGTNPSFVYVLTTGIMAFPSDNVAQVACVSGV